MRILALNTGSNSLKFELVDLPVQTLPGPIDWGRSTISGSYDDIGKPSAVFQLFEGKKVVWSHKQEVRDHAQAATRLLQWIETGGGRDQGVASLADIERVAHRIVHGADEFPLTAAVSAEVIQRIEALDELAPLHNAPALEVIRATQEKMGGKPPMWAVFDTAFHRSIPARAALYAIPADLARRHRVRRYGFHGISHQYMALRYAQLAGRPIETLKLITLHLEGGSSVAAIRGGVSVDTSMGFTPLEGLMMGTRSGDLDPALVTYLMRKEHWTPEEADTFLNKRCGLLGVSGVSSDTRELLRRRSEPQVQLALDLFAYRVRKYIGAYLAALGGADAIIFGGGIGENTALVRHEICSGLAWCGAPLDERRNEDVIDREDMISPPDARMPIWVVPTQEGRMMAHAVSLGS